MPLIRDEDMWMKFSKVSRNPAQRSLAPEVKYSVSIYMQYKTMALSFPHCTTFVSVFLPKVTKKNKIYSSYCHKICMIAYL